MKSYNSIYLGIVVQNNDPEKRGRVKVYVPNISANIYDKWMQDKLNKKFKFPGSNINSDLTPIMQDLKKILPWSDVSCPLFSENASCRFNNYNLNATISDSNFATNTKSASSTAPGEAYEKSAIRLNDAFDGGNNIANNANPYAYMYKPNLYSNKAKGSFGIPSVGSHVYVFFREGNPLFPVLLGASFGTDDWKGIYDNEVDYPGKYENFDASSTEEDANVDNYRNKYVLNQKGGVFEIVNTDLNEKLKLTHYSGSFKEFNNQTNIELASKNDQKLVLNDQFNTVQGNKNEYTGKNLDTIITRDNYRKVGTLNKEYFDKWKEVVSVIQDNKQLFEIRRSTNNNVTDSDGNVIIKRNSLNQKREGSFRTYPVTDGTDQYMSIAGGAISSPTYSGSNIDDITLTTPAQGSLALNNPTNSQWVAVDNNDWGPGGEGKSLASEGGEWESETEKDNIQTIIENNLKNLTETELELGLGGSEIIEITKHKLETIGVVMNDFGSIRMDAIGKLTPSDVSISNNATYLNKKGTPLIEYVHVQDLPGGNYTLNVCNRYNVMVGAGGLHMKSYGPVDISGSITNIAGEQVNIGSDNEINIDADVVNISGEILRLRNKNQRQVLVDSSLGVNKNVVIGGGLYVEGETYLQHVTAPREYQETETTKVTLIEGSQAKASFSGIINGQAGSWVGTITVDAPSGGVDNAIVQEHSHAFANLPLTLTSNNATTRSNARNSGILNEDRDTLTIRSNGKK